MLFGDSKDQVWDWHQRLKERLADLRLRLHRNKTQLRPTRAGIKFLGFVLRPEGRRLQQSTIRRFSRRCRRMKRQFRQGSIAAPAIRRSLKAWLAHASNANSMGIRRELWKRLVLIRNGRRDDG